MSTLYNLARMTTATTGTGTVTLGAAVPPWLTFALAGVQSGDIVAYAIKDGSANSEEGFGQYNSVGPTLSRNVTNSTNSGSPINLSGAAEVYITPRTQDIVTSTGCGRLIFGSATQIVFVPYNGSQIKIAGSLNQVPGGGTTAANTSIFVNGTGASNLAASTTYLVAMFVNAGTLTMDFLTTLTHSTDATSGNIGTEIKNGDNSRSVIGMVRTNASSQFQISTVRSWFNRLPRTNVGAVASTVTTTSATLAELSTNARVDLLIWSGEEVEIRVFGALSASVATADVSLSLGLDGATTGLLGATIVARPSAITGTLALPAFGMNNLVTTEGYHFISPIVSISTGTGTFANCYAQVRMD